MKLIIIFLLTISAFSMYSKAESDTLVINLNNSQMEKIPLSQIQNIRFENITGIDEQVIQANNLAVIGNNPNPFSEQTLIDFEIGSPGNVEINIYDNSGNTVKTLGCNNCQIGKNSLQWDCLNDNNIKVQSGIYYYDVRFNNEFQSKKMILVR